MHITVGGALMLVGLLFVWIFAAAVANDQGCRSIEDSVAMAGLAKEFTKFFLLCWLG